ncbi:MAG TPA: rRNA maturation RNase YbeY [Candidatus Pacearchaeota archaeon]|nr:rRNA maturation RNase YbeY [Candidatus Pacearchaeota archaeon]
MIDIIDLAEDFKRADKKFLKSVASKVLKGEKIEKEISLALVGRKEMQSLNQKYQKKNQPTDVLSFGSVDDVLPQIVICPKEVERNARKNKIPFQEELARVLIHGLLHLSGLDHQTKEQEAAMFKKQEEYFSLIM